MPFMRLDHLSFAAGPDGLASTAQRIGGLLGKDFIDGGVHPRFGTRNMIMPLEGHTYIEIVEVLDHPASDKAAFGQAVRARSALGGGWLGWVVAVDDITTVETGRGTRRFTISGVLNVPTGRGPFPAVVLAHGYIDPAYYVRGQGMTRERGVLASRGYVALHVDYRGHAESTDDPRADTDLRLGYSADVIAAVTALRRSADVPVDDDRVALMGRSIGGGVVMKALAAEPGLVQAASLWASVSSLEGENFDRFVRPDGDARRDAVVRAHGLPERRPAFWRAASARPFLDDVTEPVLLVHGRYDDTCPPRWARATYASMQRAGVRSTLAWYDDGHAFGPAFTAAMDRTIRFFDQELGVRRG
jgi:uncharacterized protein